MTNNHHLKQVDAIADHLKRWIACESPSNVPTTVNRMIDLVEEAAGDDRIAAERIRPGGGAADHLLLRYSSEQASGKQILLLSHLDPVRSKIETPFVNTMTSCSVPASAT